MKAKFEEVKKINCYVNVGEGNFALESCVHNWFHCREQFAAKFKETTSGFYFSHRPNKGQDIAEFLSYFEHVIASNQNIDFSSFSQTTKNTIIWVKASKFWLDCPMKRSLLTLVLRCGKNFEIEKNNFDDALFGDYKECFYLKETKFAVLRFMFGFTKFTRKLNNMPSYAATQKHGWREEFHKLDINEARRRLVFPNLEYKSKNIIGLESLWT